MNEIDRPTLERRVQSVEFPGNHIGWLLHPKSFAAKVNEILG